MKKVNRKFYVVFRGFSWQYTASTLRAAIRNSFGPSSQSNYVSFRFVRSKR